MCLTCAYGQMSKEDKENLFKYSRHKSYLRTQDNQLIQLDEAQINEIIEHALYIITTGVDMSCDIWAIQWPTDYIVKSFNLTNKPVETTNEQPKKEYCIAKCKSNKPEGYEDCKCHNFCKFDGIQFDTSLG